MNPGRPDRPTVAIVNECHGVSTEAWIRRHTSGLRRFQPLLISRRPPPAGASEVPSHLVLRPRPSLWRPGALPGAILRWTIPGRRRWLRCTLVRHDARLVHVHFLWNAIWLLRDLPGRTLPVVVTAHGSDVNLALVDEAYRVEVLRVLNRVDLVLCVSEFVRGRLASLGCPPERLIVLPLGAPLRASRPREAEDVLRCVCVAGLRPEKGHLHLLRAFAEVAAREPRAELTLVGEGEEREAITRLVADLGLGARVRLLGALTEPEVFAELARSDVYVQHSVVYRTERALKEEGLPISMVEAAGMGLPIVATDVGGIPEICRHEHNGLSSPAGDVSAMARNLLRLAADPELRGALGERGRALAALSFDQERLFGRLEDLYGRLLTES